MFYLNDEKIDKFKTIHPSFNVDVVIIYFYWDVKHYRHGYTLNKLDNVIGEHVYTIDQIKHFIEHLNNMKVNDDLFGIYDILYCNDIILED